MANELLGQSQSRAGTTVLWVVIHTAEGPTGPGAADALLRFFAAANDKSCHAVADDDKLLDALVPYDRAAWTLRNGNNYSDNLEMCGLASWSAATWMQHTGMLDNAARWVAGRLKARGFPVARLSAAQVAARTARGYIDHNTYTVATGDGTHWDVGPNFPWAYFAGRVAAFHDPTTPTPEDPMAGITLDNIRKVVSEEVSKVYGLLAYGDQRVDTLPDTHPENTQRLRDDMDAGFTALREQIAALTPPAPAPTPVPPTPSV